MKTHATALIAGSLLAVSLAAAPANANESFGNDLKADTEASVQVAGYWRARIRAAIRRSGYRRVNPNGGNGVRG